MKLRQNFRRLTFGLHWVLPLQRRADLDNCHLFAGWKQPTRKRSIEFCLTMLPRFSLSVCCSSLLTLPDAKLTSELSASICVNERMIAQWAQVDCLRLMETKIQRAVMGKNWSRVFYFAERSNIEMQSSDSDKIESTLKHYGLLSMSCNLLCSWLKCRTSG